MSHKWAIHMLNFNKERNKMQKSENTSFELGTNGVTFLELLFLLFLGLKLADKIDWEWIWVFSPLWIPLLCLGVLIIIAIIIVVCYGLAKKGKK